MTPQRNRRKRLGYLLGAVACLAAVLSAGLWTRPGRRASYGVSFSPGGDRLAAVLDERTQGVQSLCVWDVATGREVASSTLPGRLCAVAYAPDATAVATGAWDGSVQLWDVATGRLLRSFSGHSTPVRGLAFLPDGRTLAAGASDGRVILWDHSTGQERRAFDRGTRLPVNSLSISRDGRFLAAAGGLGAKAVSVWDLETGQLLDIKELAGAGEPVAFAPDRAVLASGTPTPGGPVTLVDVPSGLSLATPANRTVSTARIGGSRSLAFSPDGRLIASGGDDETVFVHEVATGRVVATFDGHQHQPPPVGDDLHRFLSHFGVTEPRIQNSVWSVAFSPDGTRLASTAEDGAVWLWTLPGSGDHPASGQALLPRPSSLPWLMAFQAALLSASLLLFASAVLGRRGTRVPEQSRVPQARH